jgi:MFS family permease
VANVDQPRRPWYHGVTRYQWLVLIIASLGWIFDVFEGQIFVASMDEAMPSLLPPQRYSADDVFLFNRLALASFLLGGALGGILFGRLSDRIGRTRTMMFTIATYSAFTFISAASQACWHLVVCRFLVAMGVGGEWAVASAMVAEVFPRQARAWSLAIFHASSVLGTSLAVAAGYFIVADRDLRLLLPGPGGNWEIGGWRLGFLLGGVPALLIIWIRSSLREPESWQRLQEQFHRGDRQASGRFLELFNPEYSTKTLVGVGLAAVGLATFWGVHVYGKNLLRQVRENEYIAEVIGPDSEGRVTGPQAEILGMVQLDEALSSSERVARLRQWLFKPDNTERKVQFFKPWAETIKKAEMVGMFLVTLGGGLGLVAFGPLAEWLGRRGAFLVFQIGGLVSALVLFRLISGETALFIALPVFGCLTLGMHAGFAVYFPELYPTRLRGTGAGFCFNMGRILAAPLLFSSGLNVSPENSASLLSLLFLVGPLLLLAAPETRGQDLT